MTWDKMLEGALPEAVGGMLVTLIVLSYERIRDSNQRKKDFDRSRLAALSELRRMRDRVETHRALLEGTVPFEIPVTSIEALIRISMNGIGRPEFEAGAAAVVR